MHILPLDIEYDPAKARANLAKHRVHFAEAEQALRDPLALTIEDPDAVGEARFVEAVCVLHRDRQRAPWAVRARRVRWPTCRRQGWRWWRATSSRPAGVAARSI